MNERLQRERMRQEVYPVDSTFLEALERGLPTAAGIALGVDRLMMLLVNAPRIQDVIPFPAEDLIEEWSRVHTEAQE